MLLGLVVSARGREPSHRFQGFYRGYLEQYAAAELPPDANEKVAVIGRVQKPGVIQPRDGLTVTNAIIESGGFADWADHHHVGIWRDTDGRFLMVNVEAIKRKEEPDLVLLKGDIVVVTGRWMTGI
jgi:protein involved in polysaccharide export with SLBB domain